MRKQLIMGIMGIKGIALSLVACSNDAGEEKTTEEQIGKVVDTVSESNLRNYTEELLDLNSYDIINDESNESSYDILWSRMAISDRGYYYWKKTSDNESNICFMDKMTETSVNLCNRPDCKHTGNDCNSFFYTSLSSIDVATDGICYDSNFLTYYDGYVYILGYNSEGQIFLYKLSEDGSERKQYMKLYKKELTEPGNESHMKYSTPEVLIHKGYVYYLIPRETVPTLYRMQLGTENVEEVFRDYVFFKTFILHRFI